MIIIRFIVVAFRAGMTEHEFGLSEGVKFKQQVQVYTQVEEPNKRFGIDQQHINGFIENVLRLEVEGRRFRTKYQIEMTSGAPQAENFLWTILGNKVRNGYNFNTKIMTGFFRKLKTPDIDFDIQNRRHCTGKSLRRW